ncbi:protein phosphatase 1 regulatory subunit 32 [Carcharodon carcharias]|uniref:protein phosphatase 1 regulatory subunit 32 n=1 Tax=Carcharodon carcharias TaxID=13397 RepID=UPI001B7DDF77|nr:protein phosphatase 1 regulatory subunit 32 [Carcharodon carcharias]
MKRKRVAKVNVGPLEVETEEIITENDKMAEALNKFFVSIFIVEDTKFIPELDENLTAKMSEAIGEINGSELLRSGSQSQIGTLLLGIYLLRMALISVDSTPHYTKTSFGADADPLKFYSTTYSTSYGHEGFIPRRGFRSGAGYVTNQRPVFYYTSSLDRLDNPILGQLLRDNYRSITKKDFVPYGRPDGKEDFPHKLHSVGSGFMRKKALNFPFLKDMKEVHIDTRDQGPSSITGIEPKHTPLLHQIQPQDPVMQENGGYGPSYMSTEYNTKYKLKPQDLPVFSQHKTVGRKENSGFTEGSPLKPITYHHPLAYRGDLPLPSGLENLPTDKIEKLKKEDPVEYLNRSHLDEPRSINTLTYTKPEHRPLKTELLGNVNVGAKEPTGFSSNEKGYIYPAKTATDADRFLTNYKLRYNDKTLKGEDREGWTRGGIQKQFPHSYAVSSKIHQHGPDYNITESLRRIHPHVARCKPMAPTL